MKRFRSLFTQKGAEQRGGRAEPVKVVHSLVKWNDLARAKRRHIKSKNWN